jgi:hypothetical protein
VLKAQRPAKQNQLFVGRSARQATQADGVVMMNAGRLIRNDGVYLICLPSGPPTAANDKKKHEPAATQDCGVRATQFRFVH